MQINNSKPLPDDYQLQVNRFIHDRLTETLAGTTYLDWLQPHFDLSGSGVIEEPTLDALPAWVCAANGGDLDKAVSVTAAWQILRRAVKLFDDVEDGDIRAGFAETINGAMGLLFIAQLAVEEAARNTELSPQRVSNQTNHAALRQSFNRAILQACAGQHLDLMAGRPESAPIDPATWLDIAKAKSGALLGWAAGAGAWTAEVDEQTLANYRQYGVHLGILLQVADDLNGIWQPDGESDLLTGCLNLAVCYALSVVEGQERRRLLSLLKRAATGDNEAEVQARQRLIDLGGQAYLLVVGRMQRQQALEALPNVASVASQPLIALLDRVLPAVKD